MTTDYLAIILIGNGSSWGRDPHKETAVMTAIQSLKDWNGIFKVSRREVTINVIDVAGYGDCAWGTYPDGWLHGINETTSKDEVITRPVEQIKRVTPRWRQRA